MAITETKITTRSSTSDLFFTDSPLTAARTTLGEFLAPMVAEGRVNYSITLSEDELVQYRTGTFADLATYSAVDSAVGIAIDAEYRDWSVTNNLNQSLPAGTEQYTQSGINTSFTCTTTYNYSETATEWDMWQSFIGRIEFSTNLVSFTDTGSQLILVHEYANSAEFTENHFQDFSLVDGLNDAGVTRTITYASV